jgi:hypothetical protein
LREHQRERLERAGLVEGPAVVIVVDRYALGSKKE